METSKYDAVIVGGGIAGLTSAVYLARAGKKIVLIEKNNEFGGLVSSFKSNGFHFEAGVRALESAGVILPMLDDLRIEIDVVRSKVSVGVEDQVVSIEDEGSIVEYQKMLIHLFPESQLEIEGFILEMKRVMKHLDVLYGIENPVFKDLKRDVKYIFKELLPWLPKFLLTVRKINKLSVPVEAYLERLITNQSLRDIISQHFFKGTPAFFAMSYFSLYLDYFYPKLGVDQLVEKLVAKIKEYRGELITNTMVTDINAFEKYVIDHNDKKYFYDHLIWAGDLKNLYDHISIEKLNSKTQKNFKAKKHEFDATKGSESVFSLYLEVDLPLSYFRNISNGHFFYTPKRKGLNKIHREELKEILLNWEEIRRPVLWDWVYRFLNFNTFEISIPGLKNKELVPPHKTGLIISFIIEHELFVKLKKKGWYKAFVSKVENTIIQSLTNSIYPELSRNIENQFSFTPISYKERINSSDGAIVGWSFERKIPVPHKIQDSGKAILSPIPDIFLAGQWAYSPAGVPMSILTGKMASDKVCSLS
ncbi:NAD(P)/FAD-dependent oxidoreductase [Flammeovirga sp. SJP92]|uniref:phytoene desaturase family protein n=1 Tax=Flammeovirga sp. SJP92 TaxID=1775430 RepID=UPI00078776CC|nr:FAD-dependent oxidoreductase [Flammeovirga sp. SJP92]KXX72185.1 hypothetical protein AVL50_00885 [Flammeovirga sp. SJP92]